MSGGRYDHAQYSAPRDLFAEGLRELLNDLRAHGAADVAERLVVWLTGPEDPGDDWPPGLYIIVDALDRWRSGDDATDELYRIALAQYRGAEGEAR